MSTVCENSNTQVSNTDLSTLSNDNVDIELISEIALLRGCIECIESQIKEEGETSELINELEERKEELNFLYWQFGCSIGLQELKQFRKQIGLCISFYNQIQEYCYVKQKARYVMCKANKHFTKEDREFIEKYKYWNEYYLDLREQFYEYRDQVAAIIEATDPNDFDFGWDEYWEGGEEAIKQIMEGLVNQ